MNPDRVQEIANRLRPIPGVRAVLDRSPGPVYLVGGSVRDLWLGREPQDLDIIVPGPLRETARAVARALGTHPVPLGREPLQIFRIPGEKILDLCPMEGPDILTDLKRRDLTFNAMALELASGAQLPRLIDPENGLTDLDCKIARFVSEDNVIADPLRLLRLFRFCAELEFNPDPQSLELVRTHAPKISAMAGGTHPG